MSLGICGDDGSVIGVAGGVRLMKDVDSDDSGGREVPVVRTLNGEAGVDGMDAPVICCRNRSRTEAGQSSSVITKSDLTGAVMELYHK